MALCLSSKSSRAFSQSLRRFFENYIEPINTDKIELLLYKWAEVTYFRGLYKNLKCKIPKIPTSRGSGLWFGIFFSEFQFPLFGFFRVPRFYSQGFGIFLSLGFFLNFGIVAKCPELIQIFRDFLHSWYSGIGIIDLNGNLQC